MNNVLNFDAFLSVPLPTEAFAKRVGHAAGLPIPPHDDADRVEGGPGLFRCMLMCSAVSLTFYGVAAWLIF